MSPVLEGGRRSWPATRAMIVGTLLGALLWLALLVLAWFLMALVGLERPALGARARLAPSTVAYWRAIAQCETGSTWGGLGSTYQGGLGIYWSTWDWWARELGLERRYPDAGDAPALVQIRVADYGSRVHGGRWGCQ